MKKYECSAAVEPQAECPHAALGKEMRWRTLALSAMLLVTGANAEPVVYRNPADARAWEVVTDASAPLVWQWADGAVSATLTVSNVLSGATSSDSVARGAAPDGSCAIPSVEGGEQLLDVTLAQTDGSAVVAEQTVRLKVGGTPVVYADAAHKDFTSITEPRLYGWSDLWAEESEGASSATLMTSVKDGAAIGAWTLPSTGGYGVMSVRNTFAGRFGWMTAALAFDGATRWTADVRTVNPGAILIFR